MADSSRTAEEDLEAWRPAGILGDLPAGELNDACCWACSGGGDVVCCDGCRAVFHLACLDMAALPDEDFFCPLCTCKDCQQCVRTPHPALCVQADMVPVRTKTLQPRQSPKAKLPDGPGYVCPQQLRLWLQQQPTAHLEGNQGQQQEQGTEAAAAAAESSAAAAEEEDKPAAEPKAKRQKRGDPVVANASSSAANNNTSTPPAAPGGSSSSDAYVRCSCCQRACRISCLPAEQQQQLAAWATQDSNTDSKDQQHNKTPPRGARRANTRSPRQQKGKAQAKQEQQDEQQQQQEQQRLARPVAPYFCSPGCKQTATALAKRCAQGAVQLDALADGTPICWQLIQPAAVAAALAATPAAAGAAAADARAALADSFGGDVPAPPAPVLAAALLGTGVAPAYTQQQAEVLAQVLRDVQQLLWRQLGPVWEVRTYQHCLPWLLSGLRQPTPGGLLDLSPYHVAVLWVGSTLAAAALVRVHGGEGGGVLEVTLAATSPLLQYRRLGRVLVAAVERFVLEGCRVQQAWMPALGGVVRPCVGLSVLPGWEREGGGRGRLQLAPGCSTKLLGLDGSPGSSAGGPAAGGSSRQAAEDAAQKVPKGVASCWALKLAYGRAANVTDWLQLTKYPLLRYSYVPFVSKRLEQQTMLPVPQFFRQQQATAARPPPAPLPPLPPQMPPLQPRFGMMQPAGMVGGMMQPMGVAMGQGPMGGPPGGVMPMMVPNQPHMMMPPQPGMVPLQPGMVPLQPGMVPVPMPMPMQQQQQPGAPPPPGMMLLQSGMQPLPAVPHPHLQQQQQQGGPQAGAGPLQPPQEGGADPAAAGLTAAGGQQVGAAAAATAAAGDSAPGPDGGHQQQQQQGGGEKQAGAAEAAAAPAAGSEQDDKGQEGSAAEQQQPASKRQAWKEQVMQQFLAQQAAFAAGPMGQKARRQSGGGGDGGASGASASGGGGEEVMQE